MTLLSVKFIIRKVRYHQSDSDWAIIEAKFIEYPHEQRPLPTTEIVITGSFVAPSADDEFEAEGVWKKTARYGWNFEAAWTKRIMPQSTKGIARFLEKIAKGLGHHRALTIAEAFGDNTFTVLDNNPERLLMLHGMGKKLVERLHAKYIRNRKYEAIATFALGNGLTHKTALRIYKAYGEASMLTIRENPYILLNLEKIGFDDADRFAKSIGLMANDPRRVRALVIATLELHAKSRGNLYVKKDALMADVNKFFQGSKIFETRGNVAKEFETAMTSLPNDEKIADVGGCIYLAQNLYIENQIVEMLAERYRRDLDASGREVPNAVRELIASLSLAKEQQEAVYMSLLSSISILTGGPGTGKTHTVNAIIKAIKVNSPGAVIHLMAPTGKAAKRMTELTGEEAKTIHRAICLNSEDDGEVVELEGDYVIVDEASMIDAFVFYKLLSAITADTRILLVGDYEQLPSVGPGLILRDLINSCSISCTRLTEIFRQGRDSQIVMNAHAIVSGKAEAMTYDPAKKDFFFLERKEVGAAHDAVVESVRRMVENQGYNIDQVQVLTAMRKGEIGTMSLNAKLQQTFNPADTKKAEHRVNAALTFRTGDKVIQIENNYDNNVFNGEVGRVTFATNVEVAEIVVEVDYGDKVVCYTASSIEEIELAYALTIHKSQGSEFPVVIMPVHDSQEIMMNKNLIYTGVTRAKNAVVLIGQKETLARAVKKSDNIQRNSRIQERMNNVSIQVEEESRSG